MGLLVATPQSAPATDKPGSRIPVINGLRGLAILMVVANHATLFSQQPGKLWSQSGLLGVDIFFVLSGYIITRRLMMEQQRNGSVNIKSFYIRRAFRILPLVFAYLIALCVISYFVDSLNLSRNEFVGTVLFFRNYQEALHPGMGIYTSHFWSLSIEEHFYLLWPALFLWAGRKLALPLAAFGAIGCALWRLHDRLHPVTIPSHFRVMRTDFRMDGLLVGCALAILLTNPNVTRFIYRNFPKETPLFCAFLIFFNELHTGGESSLTTYLLIAVALASMLIVEEGLAHQWMSSRALVWLGTISYSLYVWQQLFLYRPARDILPLGHLSVFPFNIVCALLVAASSFYFIERPAIELGKSIYATKVYDPPPPPEEATAITM
jgi:peptidoglycan/LPS O-acetylase OafA/YrhL